MIVNCRRIKNDFAYCDYYTCETSSINATKSIRHNYTEDSQEYRKLHWKGKELWEWIIMAYEAGKNNEELKFIQAPVQKGQKVNPYYKMDKNKNLLDAQDNIIGYQDTNCSYWGEKTVIEEPVINGKLKSEILKDLWENYLKENNIDPKSLEETKKVIISEKEAEEDIHYDKNRKNYNLINIDWDNQEILEN